MLVRRTRVIAIHRSFVRSFARLVAVSREIAFPTSRVMYRDVHRESRGEDARCRGKSRERDSPRRSISDGRGGERGEASHGLHYYPSCLALARPELRPLRVRASEFCTYVSFLATVRELVDVIRRRKATNRAESSICVYAYRVGSAVIHRDRRDNVPGKSKTRFIASIDIIGRGRGAPPLPVVLLAFVRRELRRPLRVRTSSVSFVRYRASRRPSYERRVVAIKRNRACVCMSRRVASRRRCREISCRRGRRAIHRALIDIERDDRPNSAITRRASRLPAVG